MDNLLFCPVFLYLASLLININARHLKNLFRSVFLNKLDPEALDFGPKITYLSQSPLYPYYLTTIPIFLRS